MPILTILKGRRIEREFPFDKDHMFIGREDGNDLILEDASVSRVHAKFQREPAGWSIVDLNSTNGIYLNNLSVKEAVVKDGDVVVLGDYTLFIRTATGTDRTGDLENAQQMLETLCLLTQRFKSSLPLSGMLETMTDALLEVFGAERAFLLLVDQATGCLADPAITRRRDPTDTRIQISKTVANRVVEEKQPILITDVEADAQFRGVKSIETDQVRSIICAPLTSDGAHVTGVVYLDSRMKSRTFVERDLALLDRFLTHAGQLIHSATEQERLKQSNEKLQSIAKEISLADHDTNRIVGSGVRMQEVHNQLKDLAKEDVTVLITGESGTGKELIAKAIHYQSKRAESPFVAVNCMALASELVESELFGHEKGAFSGALARKIGKFEQAEGGTIFLDEIGELSLPVQVKLLRVLQERSICRVGGAEDIPLDIRLVTATNRNLEQAIAEGKFRDDLFYRINVFNLELPPLRERRDDIPALVKHFVGFFNRRMGKQLAGVTPETQGLLTAYEWPGNIRELRNVIERAFVVEKGAAITPQSLPFGPRKKGGTPSVEEKFGAFDYPADFDTAKDLFEKHFIIQSLKKHAGNITLTAKETGLPRRTLYRRLEKFGIDAKELLSADSLAQMEKKA
jgi:Nif-specific regulatory protein